MRCGLSEEPQLFEIYHVTIFTSTHLISNLGGKPELLWTNSKLTSEFTAQTISVNLSKYNSVIIEFIASINYTDLASRVCYKKNDTFAMQTGYMGGGITESGTARSRGIVSINNNGVQFSDAYAVGSKTNNVMIPSKIYGVNLDF